MNMLAMLVWKAIDMMGSSSLSSECKESQNDDYRYITAY